MNTATQHARSPTANQDDLIIASRVKDTPVFNTSGDRIGHVEDLSIERTTGHVRYALMSFGGFLGIGDKLHPIPWRVLKFDTERNGYVVPLNKSELEEAPHYTSDQLQAYGGRDIEFRDGLYGFYGKYGAVPPAL